MNRLHAITLIGLFAAGACGSALAATYAITWNTVDCGGGVGASASYRINGSIGQPAGGFTKSTSFLHWAGFSSGEIPTPTVVSTVDGAKLIHDGTFVSVSGKIATSTETDFPGFFYLEEPNRSNGMRVAFPSGAVAGIVRGMSVINVIGTLGTTPAGERQIAASVIVITSTNPLALGPLGMPNRNIGGGNLGLPPLGQYGITGGAGLNNVGLFIKTWGRVSYVDNTYMLISDGSGQPVKIDTSVLSSLPHFNDYISVVGISSLYTDDTDNTQRLPLILPLTDSDYGQ